MKWNKYTLKTRTEAEDLISSMMQDVGIEGIEIEDKVPLSQREKEQMFVDILPEGPADDGVAYISFLSGAGCGSGGNAGAGARGLKRNRRLGRGDRRSYDSGLRDRG